MFCGCIPFSFFLSCIPCVLWFESFHKMAKITYTAIVSDIRGKLRGDVFTAYRGTHIIRTHCANPANPQTIRQQQVRANWSTTMGCWWHLPTTYQELWEKYGQRKTDTRTGIGAYMQANARLLNADHPELVKVEHPPPTPSTPMAVQNFQWTFITPSTARIQWTLPAVSTTFIQVFHRLNWDYSPTYNIYWAHVITVRSDCGQYDWLHPYPIGTDLFIKLRSLDKWGRTSPYTHKDKKIVGTVGPYPH